MTIRFRFLEMSKRYASRSCGSLLTAAPWKIQANQRKIIFTNCSGCSPNPRGRRHGCNVPPQRRLRRRKKSGSRSQRNSFTKPETGVKILRTIWTMSAKLCKGADRAREVAGEVLSRTELPAAYSRIRGWFEKRKCAGKTRYSRCVLLRPSKIPNQYFMAY